MFPLRNKPLITFGGISSSTQVNRLLEEPNISAVAIGNFLNYKEHAIQDIKLKLSAENIRPARYDFDKIL